jgi:hypothetical protein
VDDDALLVRQAKLQREATTFARELGLIEMLGRQAACFSWAAP